MINTSQREIQVLHIDDNPSITDLTGTFLERGGDRFTVETAANADEGLERINDCLPDCVVSDYNMPDMDGIELLQAIREEYPSLPFILFTGKGSETVASDAIAAGVTDYLQKGTGTEQYELLANRIRNAVTARRESRRADRQEELMRLTEFAGDTGGFEVDIETGEVLLTDGANRILTLPDDPDLTVEAGLQQFHPDDQPEIRRAVDHTYQTGEKTQGTWRYQPEDSESRLLRVKFTSRGANENKTAIQGAIQDVTDRTARDRRIQFLQTLANEVTELSINFLRIKERQIDTLINDTLEQIGTLVDADRTYVFDIDDETGTLSNTYEWCSAGVEPQIDTLQELPQETVPWWIQRLENFDNITIPNVSELPPEAEAEQAILEEQNIKSLIVTPMISDDELVGFIGFDWVKEQTQWSDEFINILRMVSELITTARDRIEREQVVKELTIQYKTLADNFPNGAVFLIDTDLEYVRAGGNELSNVGLCSNDVEGMTPHALFPEAIADELCHYYQRALDGTAHTFEQEYKGERYQIQTVPVRTDNEEIDHVMAVSQNITERVADKRERERQNARLEEFSSVVSHDLRTPLRVATGRLELVREECNSEHIGDVARALDRMDALIEDLLTLAREGKRVGETKPIDLASAAENSWQTVNTKQAVLETETAKSVEADRSRLQQLFENLYRNAIEHGGDAVTVSVGSTDDSFYVSDTGPGIPEPVYEKVFEAGYSTAEDGTGFGLRIVEQIAEAHGWKCAVTEGEQGGARFEFTVGEYINE